MSARWPELTATPDAIRDWLAGITLEATEHLLFVDKPAGLPVQRGTRTTVDLDTLVGIGFAADSVRPRLVHRLDKDTAGCLVLARSLAAARHMQRQFAAGRVEKEYRAILAGHPGAETGMIDVPLVKARTAAGDRVRPAEPHELAGAWSAITEYEVLRELAGGLVDIRLLPRTGRQHQLRAHMAALGCPILGDRLHAGLRPDLGAIGETLHLAAVRIAFRDPGGASINVSAPPPAHLRAALARLGGHREIAA
jgi:23S rRNA pseudouridine955/2504/2580 synthase